MRADIPLGLDMLACVWKLLVGAELDPVTDLKEADLLTYNYIKKIEMVGYQENQKCFFLLVENMQGITWLWVILLGSE